MFVLYHLQESYKILADLCINLQVPAMKLTINYKILGFDMGRDEGEQTEEIKTHRGKLWSYKKLMSRRETAQSSCVE